MAEKAKPCRRKQTEKIRNSWMSRNTNFDPVIVTKDQLNDLREMRWLRSCHSLFHTPGYDDITRSDEIFLAVCNNWFDEVIQRHKESQRHYHTLYHLLEMFSYLDALLQFEFDIECMDDCDCPPKNSTNVRQITRATLEMATFFHDAVYNPKSGTNEEDSAELYKCFVADVIGKLTKNSDTLDKIENEEHSKVMDYILATKQHSVSPSADIYLKMFLDVDMSVLGKHCDSYDAYAGLIRQEYIHVDRELYCTKRAEVLTQFLAEGNIFNFEPMNEAFEVQARNNIEREIAMLHQGKIPREPAGVV